MELDAILNEIKKEEAAALYISGKNCNVCKALKPKITNMLDAEFPRIKQIYIDIEESPEVSSHFSVFSIPTLVIFFDGKEFIRKSRNMSLPLLQDELSRPYSLFFK